MLAPPVGTMSRGDVLRLHFQSVQGLVLEHVGKNLLPRVLWGNLASKNGNFDGLVVLAREHGQR